MSRSVRFDRRQFVNSVAASGVAVGLGDLAFLSRLPPVSRKEQELDQAAVKFDSGIEPLVQLIETTERDRLLEEVAARIHKGTSYREVLTALLLAGIRNIPPRPDVGWKFHAVLCINSAHLASLSSPPEDRWLPIFYAIDFFKGQQLYDERESDWSLSQVSESEVPPAHRSREAFDDAMENWQDAAADAATAALVRAAGAAEVFERFTYYGMRDFRNIGHKEIYLANSWRTLQCIGWQRYAEPVMRSLTYALLNHHDEPNPSESDLEFDRPWRSSLLHVDNIRDDWRTGDISSEATSELLSTMRSGSWSEANEQVVDLLNNRVSPQSIQDALFIGSMEILMRQPNIYALHAVTATNAMAYAFRTTGNDRTRRLLLLQNAAFLPQFRDHIAEIGERNENRVDELKSNTVATRGEPALEEIFGEVDGSPYAAAELALNYLDQDGQTPEEFMNAARRLIFIKTQNSHDYKFSSAVMEDYYQISPEWRNRYLASSVHYLRGTAAKDNQLVQRTRAALDG
ncbi:MAG: hypothetical protein ACR2NP_07615 [Pirellulaceae bacterium]